MASRPRARWARAIPASARARSYGSLWSSAGSGRSSRTGDWGDGPRAGPLPCDHPRAREESHDVHYAPRARRDPVEHAATRASAQELSSLIGPRLLLNIFDTRKVLLPKRFTEERRHEHELFYSERNIRLGEAIRPFPEWHVFSFAEAEASERGTGVNDAAINAGLAELQQARREAASAPAALVSGSPAETGRHHGRHPAARPVAVGSRQAPRRSAGVIGGPLGRNPAIVARGPVEQALGKLFTKAGLRTEPHAYYQLTGSAEALAHRNLMSHKRAGRQAAAASCRRRRGQGPSSLCRSWDTRRSKSMKRANLAGRSG